MNRSVIARLFTNTSHVSHFYPLKHNESRSHGTLFVLKETLNEGLKYF